MAGGRPVAAAAQPRRGGGAVAGGRGGAVPAPVHRRRACSRRLPGMLYLLLRCACRRSGRRGGTAPSTPLLVAITPGLDPARRVRWLRGAADRAGARVRDGRRQLADAVDVIYAVMEGATKLIHGVLPYGHMPPGVIHGDTYPILTYALYTPLALVAPVHATYGTRSTAGSRVAVAGGAASALGGVQARRRRRAAGPARRDRSRSRRPGCARRSRWLAFPPLLITASTGTTDVVLAAMLAIAVLLWRRPRPVRGDAGGRRLVQARAVRARAGVRWRRCAGGRLARALAAIVAGVAADARPAARARRAARPRRT